MDAVAAFTVTPIVSCENDQPVTFWSLLATSNSVLCRRSAEGLQARAAQLGRCLPCSVGNEPAVLNSAAKLVDGRWTGVLDGRRVRLSVVAEGELTVGPRALYVEAIGGKIFALQCLQPAVATTGIGRSLRTSQRMAIHTARHRASAAAVPTLYNAEWLETLASGVQGQLRRLLQLLRRQLSVWRQAVSFDDVFIAMQVCVMLLISVQLCLLHAADALSVPEQIARQEILVKEAREEVLQLVRSQTGEMDAIQHSFACRMSVLEPRLRASERRLAELKWDSLAASGPAKQMSLQSDSESFKGS